MSTRGQRLLQALKESAGSARPCLCLAVGVPPIALLRPIGVRADQLDDADVSRLTDWRNENRNSFLTEFDSSYDRTRNWLSGAVANDDSRILFMLDDSAGRTFGYMGLAQIDWASLVGEADAIVRGADAPRGAMTAALRALIGWAAHYLELGQITVRVRSDNPAVGFYEHIGFREMRRIPLRSVDTAGMREWVPDPEAESSITLVYMEYPLEMSR